MPASLENSAVATRLQKVSFHFNPKERQCQRMSKSLHNFTHLIHGHRQMVNTEIRLNICFAAKDGEALYSQQKQDQVLTVAQILNSLLQNSDLN